MRRLKCEKETIILTNEDDGFYGVYTFNQSLQKRLQAFAEKYPDDCWLKGSSEDGSETYMIKKGSFYYFTCLPRREHINLSATAPIT